MRIEWDGETEELAVEIGDELAALKEQARKWHTRWAYTFGALLIAVATVIWGGIYVAVYR